MKPKHFHTTNYGSKLQKQAYHKLFSLWLMVKLSLERRDNVSKYSNQLTAWFIHFFWCFVELLGSLRQVLAFLHQLVQISLPLQQFLDALMQNHLGFLDFTHGFGQFIGIFRVLIFLELNRNGLNVQILIIFEFLPLVSHFFKKDA